MPSINLPDGVSYNIDWPPSSDEDWRAMLAFLRNQDEFLHKLLRAVVALEKKVHWGLPTQPLLRKRCVFQCIDPDTGEPVDIISDDDEGDGGGTGSGPGGWG